jgi:hypothetical protein
MRSSLRGVKAVALAVTVSGELERRGLSEKDIARGVRARLGRAGVSVLEVEQARATKTPLLYVRAFESHIDVDGEPLYAIALSARLIRQVALPDGSLIAAATWYRDFVCLSAGDSFGNALDGLKRGN